MCVACIFFLVVSEVCRPHFKIVEVNICNLFKNIINFRDNFYSVKGDFPLVTELENLLTKSFRILVESKNYKFCSMIYRVTFKFKPNANNLHEHSKLKSLHQAWVIISIVKWIYQLFVI